MNKEILMELEIERGEELYSDDIWCLEQYEKLEEEGLGEIEFFPCDGWDFHYFEPHSILKEILEKMEIEGEEKLYSDDDWCRQQYISNEYEYGLKECLELEQQGLGVVEYYPWGDWDFRPLGEEPYDIYDDEIYKEIEEEKWEEIFFTREEENMEEEEMIGIKLDGDTLGDWDKVFEKLKEVENLPMDWEWEFLDEHYNGNFTEYTVLIGEHIYEVSFFTTSRDEETGDILEERMEYYYLQSLEEYQKEQEERENSIGGWEF